MYIWKLERGDEVDYDETSSLIVIAETEQRAREIAHDEARGDQSHDIWYAPSTEATCLGTAFPTFGSGIQLVDFQAG